MFKSLFSDKKLNYGLAVVASTIILYYLADANNEPKANDPMQANSHETRHILVKNGNDRYQIPVNHLTANNDLPAELNKDGLVEATVFLPDFSGYDNKHPAAARYHPEKIEIAWTTVGSGMQNHADTVLQRSLDFALSERAPGADAFSLIAYKSTTNDDMTYHATTVQNNGILIHCLKGTVNHICKVEYFHQTRRVGMFYSFDQRYLKDWRPIDSKINQLIDYWQSNGSK